MLLCLPTFGQAKDLESVIQQLSSSEPFNPVVVCEPDASTGSVALQNDQSLDLTVVSEEKARELFDMLRTQPDIPFLYPQDGCYSRAHRMARLLEDRGIISAKIFVTGNLQIETDRSPEGYVGWNWHVAPAILVRKNGVVIPMVIDPAIFSTPVTVSEWTGAQTKHQYARIDSVYLANRFTYDRRSRMDYTSWNMIQLEWTEDKNKQLLELQNNYSRP